MVDRSGQVQALSEPMRWGNGRLSPDGKRVANIIRDTTSHDVWILEIARRTLTRLTLQGAEQGSPVIWTPDGKRVTFSTRQEGKPGIYWMRADGTSRPELLVESDVVQYPSSWSPDGKMLVYEQPAADKKPHLWVLPVSANGAAGPPRPMRESPSGEDGGRVSPDGRWIVFGSVESGREIYVQPFPGPGPMLRISTNGGSNPRWSHSGREIFYWEGDVPFRLMSVAFPAGPSPTPGNPRKLFDIAAGTTFDVFPDDNHFLVEAAHISMEVIDNWFDELRRRLPPTGK